MKYFLSIGAVGLLVLMGCEPAKAQTPASVTNSSVTITTGNTFQQVLAGGASRALTVQNNNLTDNCWVYLGTVASATKARAVLLLPGGSYTRHYPFVPSDIVAGTCATTADTLYVETIQ